MENNGEQLKKKKFSIIQYQEELIEKLNKEQDKDLESFIFLEDKNKKIWKINFDRIEFIEELRFSTLLPPFKDGVLAVTNIQEKEILLIDIDAYIYKEKSIWRNNEVKNEELMKKYKCLLLKNKKIGLMAKILPSYEMQGEIGELNIEEIIGYVDK